MAAIYQNRILLVEDDEANRDSLERILKKEGYAVLLAEDGHAALNVLREEEVDLIVTDLKMPRMDGMDLLKAAKAIRPHIDVILITAHGTIEMAVEAIKEGAYDFIPKPFKRATILRIVEKNLEKQTLRKENERLRGELARYRTENRIIGKSGGIQHVLDMISQVAPSSATVLIQGESGTGKELVAEAIHRQSPRESRPFIKVSCAALPETLLEAELFGHEKGAFTGAINRKEGRFEAAHSGTLFLDEIGDISPNVQVKLLRVLQDGEFERIGGTQRLRTDVRIIAATNRNLQEAIKDGHFREDLFYRLNVVNLTVPPLRNRSEDVLILADHFLRRYSAKNDKEISSFSKEVLEKLQSNPWPGNVRELENAIERAVVLCKENQIGVEHLPEDVRIRPQAEGDQIALPMGMKLSEVEKVLIQETLRRSAGDKNLAAKILGITPRTIYRKLEEWDEVEAGD